MKMYVIAKTHVLNVLLSDTLVNKFSGKNFSDYINSLRVEEAKRCLRNPGFEAYTMVAIGLECGFNSKSTFYTAFKKFTGQTPTSFRKSPV